MAALDGVVPHAQVGHLAARSLGVQRLALREAGEHVGQAVLGQATEQSEPHGAGAGSW